MRTYVDLRLHLSVLDGEPSWNGRSDALFKHLLERATARRETSGERLKGVKFTKRPSYVCVHVNVCRCEDVRTCVGRIDEKK